MSENNDVNGLLIGVLNVIFAQIVQLRCFFVKNLPQLQLHQLIVQYRAPDARQYTCEYFPFFLSEISSKFKNPKILAQIKKQN